MKITIVINFLFLVQLVSAQKPVFDVFSYTAPAGWTKEEKKDVFVSFTTINKQKGNWCRVALYKSTAGQGNPLADLQAEWQLLVEKIFQQQQPPQLADSSEVSGWKTYMAFGIFPYENQSTQVLLRTYSAPGRCASLLVNTNDLPGFETVIGEFMASVEISPDQPVSSPALKEPAQTKSPAQPAGKSAEPIATAFRFNKTEFEDGWTSVVKEDWVEVTKGNIRVLLHYPRAEEKEYISQQDAETRKFWNLLVAPRYSHLRNYEMLNYNTSFEPAHFAGGLLKDNNTGQDVWVTLFSKAKSGWIEIITPDKQTFVNAFGINNPDNFFTEWEPLQKLSGYNRFAVGEKDLPGKWSSDFTGATSLYNVYTGVYAGSNIYSSSQHFEFLPGNKYNWALSAASSTSGAGTHFANAKGSGTYKHIGNWQIWVSDIERKPKTYNAYFSCIKGGRILWLQDTGYGSYTSYGKVE